MTPTTRLAVAFLMGTLICGAGATAVFGQNASQSKGVPHSLEEVLATLTDLGRAVAGLQEDVDHIRETLDTLPQPEADYRVTPAIDFATGALVCSVTNVSDVPKTVVVGIVNASTGIAGSGPPQTIGAGRSTSLSNGAPNIPSRVYCRFTVLDGTRFDIRGALFLSQSATGGFNPTLVVPAE
jgi:hypothetical protein